MMYIHRNNEIGKRINVSKIANNIVKVDPEHRTSLSTETETRITSLTSKGDFKVWLELRIASCSFLKERIRNSEGASPSAGTAHCDNVQDVGVAADKAEVGAHAPANAHAPIAS